MSLIIFTFASLLISIIAYWISLLAVIITALKGTGEFKTVVIVGIAAFVNYLWLVLLNAVEMGKLPGYVLMHWMFALLVVGIVCHGIRLIRQGRTVEAESRG